MLSYSELSYAQSSGAGAELFKSKCGICHTIGGGRLVGPDLSGAPERRTEDWLLRFIRSSQAMIKSGDAVAVGLFKEFNETIMPDPMLSDDEIKSVIQHIKDQSGGASAAAAYVSVLENAGEKDIALGRHLFEGRQAFANGGPSCIACHNGLADTYFNEKSYAKDLAASFATLGEAGTRAILENPPFPVMAQAFEGKTLTPDEVRALLAFLKTPGGSPTMRKASGFMVYGVLGAAALIIVFSGLWYSRKDRSVNHSIYKRQIKSVN